MLWSLYQPRKERDKIRKPNKVKVLPLAWIDCASFRLFLRQAEVAAQTLDHRKTRFQPSSAMCVM